MVPQTGFLFPIFAFRIKCMLIACTFRIHFLELNTCSSRKLPNCACHFENSKFVANITLGFLGMFLSEKIPVIIFLELPLAPRPYKLPYRNCDLSCAPDTFENCRNSISGASEFRRYRRLRDIPLKVLPRALAVPVFMEGTWGTWKGKGKVHESILN